MRGFNPVVDDLFCVGHRFGVGLERTEVRGQRSEDRGQRTEVRGQKSGAVRTSVTL